MKFAAHIILGLSLFACNEPKQAFNKLAYRFHDASVPPPHHRSFTITITPTSIEELVDSYGDTLSYVRKNVSQSDFDDVVKAFDEAQIRKEGDFKEDGCTGGTGVSIQCYNNAEKTFDGYVSICGGREKGNFKGDRALVLKALKEKLAE